LTFIGDLPILIGLILKIKRLTESSVKHSDPIPYIPAEVRDLVGLCKAEMMASEVWLFGSRARGDNHLDSDFDILAIIPDDAPDEIDAPRFAYRLRRQSGAHADLLTVRFSEYVGASSVPNTISYAVAHEGVRLDA
jgi:predicted nucleotidyltransferase